MENVPGAIYRSAWHADYTLELISDEIERISGYPPANFLASTKRTILSIVHPDDVDMVLEAVARASTTATSRSQLEYRIVRADGEVRWVLDRGQLVPRARRAAVDGRRDVRHHRAPRGRGGAAARTRSRRRARPSCAPRAQRIVEAADAARRKIERDLHDGAQQRLVSLVLDVQVARRRLAKDPSEVGPFLERLGRELQEASAELRELARGIHPAVLTERGLAAAIGALAARSPVPVEVVDPPTERLPPAVEATAYFTVAEALTNVAKYAQATPRRRAARAARATTSSSRSATTASAARATGAGLGPERARRPRRRLRRHAERRQPGRRRAPCVRAVLPLNGGRLEPWPATADGLFDDRRRPAQGARPVAEGAQAAGGRVKVRRETSGRRGKTVTTISDVPLADDGLQELAGRLKKRCGVGGSVKDGVIELQGDHRDVVIDVLRADGYDVVAAGG